MAMRQVIDLCSEPGSDNNSDDSEDSDVLVELLVEVECEPDMDIDPELDSTVTLTNANMSGQMSESESQSLAQSSNEMFGVGPSPPTINLDSGSQGSQDPLPYWYPGVSTPPPEYMCTDCVDNDCTRCHGFICNYCGGCCECCTCDEVAVHRGRGRESEAAEACSDSDADSDSDSMRSGQWNEASSSSRECNQGNHDDDSNNDDYNHDDNDYYSEDNLSDMSTASSLFHTGARRDDESDSHSDSDIGRGSS